MSDLKVNDPVFIITSLCGNGHKQVADVLLKKAKESNRDVKVAEIMTDYLGKYGEKIVKAWNGAQQSGDLPVLKNLVKLQPLADLFMYPIIKRETLERLEMFDEPPVCIKNTQVLGMSAIAEALLVYNAKIKKSGKNPFHPVKLEIWMTDLPEKAEHFYGPIRRLSREKKELVKLVAPYPTKLGSEKMNSEEALEFLSYKTGLKKEQIQLLEDASLPVNSCYLNNSLNQVSSLTLDGLDNPEREQFVSLVPNMAGLDEERKNYFINEQDKVYSLLLGSQPNKAVVEKSIEQLALLARQADNPNQKYHFIIFCGKDEPSDQNTLYKNMCRKLNEMDLPPNLSILPLPFQTSDSVAKILARSDKRFIRSGGASCFENKALSSVLTKQSDVYIWSECPLPHHFLRGKEDRLQEELLSWIPYWELGNAINMGGYCVSSATFPHLLASDFYKAEEHSARIPHEDIDSKLFDKVNGLYKRFGLERFWRVITGTERREVKEVAKLFSQAMDRLEKISIRFSENGRAVQGVDFDYYLQNAQSLRGRLSEYSSLKKELNSLDRRILALQYRLTGKNGGVDKKENILTDSRTAPEAFLNFDKLAAMVEKWKGKQFRFKVEKEITEEEKRRLLEALPYKDFTRLLFKDKTLQHEFFEWTIRHRLSAEAFIEYASVNKVVPKPVLSKIGTVSSKLLSVQNEGKEKKLSLQFCYQENGQQKTIAHSVLDTEKLVRVGARHSLTMQSIFQTLNPKQNQDQQFEVFEEGIQEWNPASISGGNKRIDLSKKDWWMQLPAFKTLNKEQVEEIYGPVKNPESWIFSPRVSHTSTSLDLAGNHAFFDMVIPDGSGQYRVFPFGRMSKRNPVTAWEKFNFLGNSSQGKFLYPDPAVYHNGRRNTGISIAINEEMGRRLMSHIAAYFSKSKDDKLLFQFLNENCAKLVQSLINILQQGLPASEKIEPYKTHVLAVQPKGLAGLLFKTPKFFRKPLIKLLGNIFRAGRGIRIEGKEYRLKNSDFWKKLIVQHPVNLVKSLKEGRIRQYYDWTHLSAAG